jgi:peptide/nickel transport system permease protein
VSEIAHALVPESERGGLLASLGRRRTWRMLSCLLLFAAILIGSACLGNAGLGTNLQARNLHPSLGRLLGTDWLGRDMFTRVLLGLRLSLWVGFSAALASAVIGVALGLAAGLLGGLADKAVGGLIDLVMSLPHLVFQILIAFAFGGGAKGVITAVALTHWASLARVIRAEAQHLKTSEYVLLSRKLGRPQWWIARHHLLPQLLPQFLVGLILMFPHAISHEAALSFLGLGMMPHTPSMGIVLAESLRHLSTGFWWLAVFPGLALLVTVKAFDILGEDLRKLLTPRMRQERP